MDTPDDLPATSTTVTFIRDEPAAIDSFQTHTRLAEAIVETIRNNSEIKVIGLLGRWGSGKSTVAKMALALMERETEPGFRVFTYDAWLHQSDPLRRSFLESLLSFLASTSSVQHENWTERLKELSGQIEDSTSIETPSLSADARWLGFSLLPVPIGVGLLNLGTFKEAFGKGATSLGLTAFLLALFFLLMPGLVWMARYLWRRKWRSALRLRPNGLLGGAFWEIVDEDGSPAAALQIFTHHSVKSSNKRTIRSGDPSSLEFGRVFQEIMREASTDKRHFVIIIDNLDRVAGPEALQMWATIRSFFLASHETEDFKHESFHPTVILPIDRHAIEQLFATAENGGGFQRARSFIDKTFDVTFEVTQPVTSDWRAFLERQMAAVFGSGYQPKWGFWTRRLFEQSLANPQLVVTPREINKLINRIAALYLQWRDEGIPVEVMALYVIERDRIEGGSLLDFLRAPSPEFDRLSPDWQRQLAALHFGVPIDKAAQILLEEPIRQAIVKCDLETFKTLVDIPGFNEIFEFATASLPSGEGGNGTSVDIVTNAALLLGTVKTNDDTLQAAAWRNLTDAYLDQTPTMSASDDLPARLKLLASHVSNERVEDFVRSTSSQLAVLLTADYKSQPVSGAVRLAASQLVSFAIDRGVTKPTFEVDVEADEFIRKLSSVAHMLPLWPQFRTSHDGTQMTEALTTALRTENRQWGAATATNCLFSAAGKNIYGGEDAIDWDSLAESATEVVRSPQNLGTSAGPAIRVLGLIAKPDTIARKRLIEMIDDETIAARLSEAFLAKKWIEVRDIVVLLLWRGKRFSAPKGTQWSDFQNLNTNYAAEIIATIRYFFPNAVVAVLWGAHRANISDTETFIENLIGQLVESGNLGQFDAKAVFANLYSYRTAVPWRLRDRFLELVNERTNFLSALETAPLGPEIAEAAQFLRDRGGDDADKAAAIMRQRVEQAGIDAWGNAIVRGDEPYGLTAKFIGGGEAPFGRKSALFDALQAAIPTLVTDAGREIRARWFELGALLKLRARKTLFQSLEAAIGTAAPAQALHLLKAGGLQFLKHAGFGQDGSAAVVNVVVPQLHSKDGRDWLKDNDGEIRGWIQHASDEQRDQVRAALAKLKSSKVEERRYSAELLLKQWSLES